MVKRYEDAEPEVIANIIGRTVDNMRIAKKSYLVKGNAKGLWPVFVDAAAYRTGEKKAGHTVTIMIDNWPEGDAVTDIISKLPYRVKG